MNHSPAATAPRRLSAAEQRKILDLHSQSHRMRDGVLQCPELGGVAQPGDEWKDAPTTVSAMRAKLGY